MLRSLPFVRRPVIGFGTQTTRFISSSPQLPLANSFLSARNGAVTRLTHRQAAFSRHHGIANSKVQRYQVRRFSDQNGKPAAEGAKGSKKDGAGRTDVTVRKQTAVQVVAKQAKDGSLMLFAVAGMVGLAYGAYVIASDYFSGASPQRIYGQACTMLKKDEEVQKILGGKIKCYGDESGNRSRRKNVKFEKYISQKGVEHVNVMFYARGENGVAEVYVDALTKNGKFYSFVVIAPFCGERLVYTRQGAFVRK